MRLHILAVAFHALASLLPSLNSVFAKSAKVAIGASPSFRWPSFSRPYSRLVGVRASEWSKYFEECMVDSAEAHELEEEIGSVEASVGDLVGSEEAGVMVKKTWDFSGRHL